MADKEGEEPGKGKAEKEETQPSHSKDTQMEVKDPVEGQPVGGPADVMEPSSSGDQKHPEDPISYIDRIVREAGIILLERELFLCRDEISFQPSFPGHSEMGLPQIEGKKLAVIRFRDTPDDINHQRNVLHDFYTAWKKENFRSSKETEDKGTSIEDSIRKILQTEIGLKNCKRIISSSDDLSSFFSQLSNAYLLFANAYPKYTQTCYNMAEFSFKMSTVIPEVLSALWKLSNGFTLSSMETAIEKLETHITHIFMMLNKAAMRFYELYTEYMYHVTSKMTFERDEEFQIGYEQPPMKAEILAFTNAVDVDLINLGEVIVQIKRFVYNYDNPLMLEEDPGRRIEE